MNRFLLALATVLTVSAAEPAVVAPTFEGFAVTPPAGWVASPKYQKPNHAMWGKIDRAYIRHTTIAEVRVSPPDPKLTLDKLGDMARMLEKKMKQQETDRIKEFHFDLKQDSRRGTPTLELTTRCIDTGVKPAAQLHSRGFMLITPDNRLLVVTVSERSDQANFQFDEAGADEFLNAVSW